MLYNFILAFFVFLLLRYFSARYLSESQMRIKQGVVYSFFYASAYVIMKKYSK